MLFPYETPRPPPTLYLLLTVLALLARPARAQQAPSLGPAAAYGLLSGGSIVAQDTTNGSVAAIPIQVLGRAGASQGIGSGVAASGGLDAQGSGAVPQALAAVVSARSQCSAQSGVTLSGGELGGRTLGAGVYAVSGAAWLSGGSHLTLTGDTATVFVFNISGSLALQDRAAVVLQGVLPRHVFWNVGGSLQVGSECAWQGVALLGTGATAAVRGIHFGTGALLGGSGTRLSRISATVGHNQFAAPSSRPNPCGNPFACTFSRPGSELIMDGSLELKKCCPPYNGALNYPSYVCFWESATEGSSDYYHRCGAIGFQVPSNLATRLNLYGADYPAPALAQNSRRATGDAYAGVFAYITGVPNYREYIYQEVPSSLTAGRRYYAEFSARLAPESRYSATMLGMLVGPSSLPYPTQNGDQRIALTPTISGDPRYRHPRNPSPPAQTLVDSLNWQRVGGVFTASSDQASTPTFKVIIGNFEDDAALIDDGPSQGTFGYNAAAYYFLDNVTLSPLTEAGPDLELRSCNGDGPQDAQLGTAPMPALVAATYAWTSSDDPQHVFSTDPNPGVTPQHTTTYYLTVTINGVAYPSQCVVTVFGAYAQQPNATYQNPTGGPDYELGSAGSSTDLDASMQGGTVVFDGLYHVVGDVRLLNGRFELRPGTVFFVEEDSQLQVVQDGILSVTGATLRAACPGQQWKGVLLSGHGTLATEATKQQRSLVRDAKTAVNSSAGNEYYLAGTDFRYNNVGLYETSTDKQAQPGEGVQDCTFTGGSYGIVLADGDYLPPHVFGGDYDNALFSGNTFTGMSQYGLYVTAGNGHFVGNTFTGCQQAAVLAFSVPNAGPAEVSNNIITVPTRPAGSNYGPFGIRAVDRTLLVHGNLITGEPAPLSTSATAPRIGIDFRGNSMGSLGSNAEQVADNTVRVLDQAVAVTTNDYDGATITVRRNTFTDNAAGVVFYPWGNQNGTGYPPNVVAKAVTAYVQCNSFINDASSTVSIPFGLWMKDIANITGGLGGNSAISGNGNLFLAAQWPSNVAKPLVNDNTRQPDPNSTSGQFLNPNPLDYKKYMTSDEFVRQIDMSTSYNSGAGTITLVPKPANDVCPTSGTGVHRAQAPFATVSNSSLRTWLDSLRLSVLTSSQQQQLVSHIREGELSPAQLDVLEDFLTAAPAPSPAVQRATALHLLHIYRDRRDYPAAARLRTWMGQHQPEAELTAYLNYTAALDHLPNLLPGLRPLAAAERALLSQAATSGTTTAALACQVLRAYEPSCACVLLQPTVAAAQPAALAQRPTAANYLAAPAYPNPATATLHVPYQLPAGMAQAELRAYDALGRLVMRRTLTTMQGEAELEVQSWASGLYQLTLTSGTQRLGTQRVAVTR